ncbi:hypothetical protein HYU91_04670 [Candidatus Collierbacteria bacterium]|nr:hypothetical protein [Candidatus Collierbacteria bacterium]
MSVGDERDPEVIQVGSGLVRVEAGLVFDKEAELRKTVLAELLRLKVVSIDESRLPGGIIVDNLNFFRGKSMAKDSDSGEDLTVFEVMERVPAPMKNGLGGQDSQKNYYHVFRDQMVATEEDLKNGVGAREMFFTLNDAADLKNPGRLRDYKGRFYLLLSELGGEFDVRNNFQPTKNEGFDSGVDSFAANVLAMIYILGEGERDEDGALWVNKTSGDSAETQKLSGSWLARMGFKSYSGLKWRDQPRELIARYGKSIPNGMLSAEDFSDRTREKMIVGTNGQLVVENTRIFFGRNRLGYQAVKISSDGTYVLLSPADAKGQRAVDGVFRAGRVGGIITRPNVVEGKVIGMRGGSYQERKLQPRIVIRRYDGEGKVHAWRVDSKVAASGLLKLRERLKKIDPTVLPKLDSLPYERQLFLLHGYMQLNEVDRGKFEGGLVRWSSTQIEAKSYLAQYSGLATVTEAGQVDASYCKTVGLLRNFRHVVEGEIGDDSEPQNRSLIEFIARITESVAFRTGTLLSKVTVENEEVVRAEMDKLNGLLLAMESSVVDFDKKNGLRKTAILRDDKGVVSSITVHQKFGSQAGADELFITFRPERNDGLVTKGGGHPRIGMTFRNTTGSFNLRVDLDKNGLSVDVGSHSGEFAGQMAKAGLTHYTYGIIDPGYQSLFGAYVKRLAQIWGVSESTWTRSRGVQ